MENPIDWIDRGIRDLTSVVPPDAKLSPKSTIAPEARGKVPGLRREGGWSGYDWRNSLPWEAQTLRNARATGANIGVRGDKFPAVDVDVDDGPLAEVIYTAFERLDWDAPRRISKEPRALYMLRSDEPLPRRNMTILDGGARAGLVEFLGAGTQYVIEGTHPSGVEYDWSGMWPLPLVTVEDIDGFFNDLATELRDIGYEVKLSGQSSLEHAEVEQDELLAPSDDALRALLERLPNTMDTCPGWDEWIKIGHAIAASARDKALGREMFVEWSDKAEHIGEATDDAGAQYDRMYAPHRVGWTWLREQLDDAVGLGAGAQYAFEADISLPPVLLTRAPDVPPIWGDPTDVEAPWHKQLNVRFAVVRAGASVVTLDEGKPEMPGVPAYPFPMMLPEAEFKRLTRTLEMEIRSGDRMKRVKAADFWLGWTERRVYAKADYYFGSAVPKGCYDLFRGWAREPRLGGSYALFNDHLLRNVCNGNEKYYEWLTAWFADIFQCPADKKGTAVALVGPQGSGKTITFQVLGELLGAYYMATARSEAITGRFNAHLHGKLLLQAEEAVWGGDRAAAGKVKDLVTGHDLDLERKGIDTETVANHVRVAVTSNEHKAWPMDLDDRRTTVFEVGLANQKDDVFFGAMLAELEEGGYEALLYDLLHREYDPATLRHALVTDAKVAQVQSQLRGTGGWWNDVLDEGLLPGGRMQTDGSVVLSFNDLYGAYARYCRDRRGDPESRRTLAGFLTAKAGLTSEQARFGGKSVKARVVPPLDDARQGFLPGAKWDSADGWAVAETFELESAPE